MRDFCERVDDANLDGELRTDQYAALVLPELDNLRAAHAWAIGEAGDLQVAIALAAHAGSLIDYAIECADWLLPLRHARRRRRASSAALSRALLARHRRRQHVRRVPRALQVEAASRAQSLYQALGLPRRVFSSLTQLARHRNALRRRHGRASRPRRGARAHPAGLAGRISHSSCCASAVTLLCATGTARRGARASSAKASA